MVYTLVIFNQQTLVNTIPATINLSTHSCKLRCVYSHEGKTCVFKVHDKSLQISELGNVLNITCFLQQGKTLEIKISKTNNFQLLTPSIQYLSLVVESESSF